MFVMGVVGFFKQKHVAKGFWVRRYEVPVLPVARSRTRKIPSLSDESANTLENNLHLLPLHAAAAMVTSARKQTPQSFERMRVDLLLASSSPLCSPGSWLIVAKDVDYLCFISDPLVWPSFSVLSVCLCVSSPSEHVQALGVWVKQLCRRRSTCHD